MIQFLKSTVADLANAVARSALAEENARLVASEKATRAELDEVRAHYAGAVKRIDELRAKLEAAERERGRWQSERNGTVHEAKRLREAAERRQPVDRERALSIVYAFLVDHWRGCNAGRYSVEIVDAILGAAKAEPAKASQPTVRLVIGYNKGSDVDQAAYTEMVQGPDGTLTVTKSLVGLEAEAEIARREAKAASQPAFTPSPTGEAPSHFSHVEKTLGLVSRELLDSQKRVRELEKLCELFRKNSETCADSLCKIDDVLGIGGASAADTVVAVMELLSNRDCFARRLEEEKEKLKLFDRVGGERIDERLAKDADQIARLLGELDKAKAEVSRLQAEASRRCPADGMDYGELGNRLHRAYVQECGIEFARCEAMGALAFELFGKGAK